MDADILRLAVSGAAGPLAGDGQLAATSWGEEKTGYAVGGGVEWMVAPNWIFRAEYLHYSFGGSSAVLPFVTTGAAGGLGPCGPGLCNWALSSGRLDINSGRVGLAYKF